MKFKIANPSTSCPKKFDVDDDKKLRAFFDKRFPHGFSGDSLGEESKENHAKTVTIMPKDIQDPARKENQRGKSLKIVIPSSF